MNVSYEEEFGTIDTSESGEIVSPLPKKDNFEVIEQTVNRVLDRLDENCAKAINVLNFEIDPGDALISICTRGNIRSNPDVKAPAQTSPNQTDDGVIELGSSFFGRTVIDGYGIDWNKVTGLNTLRVREFVILHELCLVI